MPTKRKLSIYKKTIYSIVFTLVFFALLELALAVLGWKPMLATTDPYVGFAGYVPLFTKETTELARPEQVPPVPGDPAQGDTASVTSAQIDSAAGTALYVTAPSKLRWFNQQKFPFHKAPNTYRIFCLGGSTTYGHPYADPTSFSGWLRELLPAADPSRQYEVINCGGISYASYRVAAVMEELLEYEPDLFIIYSGHNEFLEARTYAHLLKTPPLLLKLGGLASRTRTFAAVQNLVVGRATETSVGRPAGEAGTGVVSTGVVSTGEARSDLLPAEVKTLLDSAVGPTVYHRDDQQRQKIVEHFEYNLRRMVQLAAARDAKVILVTPASNIGQCSPFKSESHAELLGAALMNWTTAYEQAKALLDRGKFSEALPLINRAVELNSRHSDTLYLRGRVLQAMGEVEQAKSDFLKARDEDVCTLRAPQEIIDCVRTVARDVQMPLVDFVQWIEQNSPDGLPGDTLFLDHVHCTIDAYGELAKLLADTILELNADDSGRLANRLSEAQHNSARERIMSGVDSRAHGAALRNVSKVYSWAGKKEDADRIALRALELLPDDAETVYQAANACVRLGQVDKGIQLYQQVIELRPDYAAAAHASLGYAYAVKGDEERCVEQYRRALKLNPNFADIHYNLATILEQRNQLEDARSHYQQAIANNSHHYQAQYRLGLVYALQQEWPLARNQFIEASRLNPTAIEPHLGLGQVLAVLGDISAARDQYRWVLARSPENDQATQALKKIDQN
ncbi:MAG: tetratricopeptide repeat protein [Pirellulaceae bacterium]|nr:tetratricopeptide repeat protein [Pirellulaceae bacterium]